MNKQHILSNLYRLGARILDCRSLLKINYPTKKLFLQNVNPLFKEKRNRSMNKILHLLDPT